MDSNTENLVSIVIPVFNAASYIAETINSILCQSYDDWEVILVDDVSSDESVNIIRSFIEKDNRIKLITNLRNMGPGPSRNRAIDEAKGHFIAFLDADDTWYPDKLKLQVEFMNAKRIGFSYTAYHIVDHSGNDLRKIIDLASPQKVDYRAMLQKRSTLGCSTVMLNKKILGIDNIRMPCIRAAQDYALWLSILRQGHTAHILPEVLMRYRITKGSVSRNKLMKARMQWEVYRTYENLPFFDASWCFINYAIRAIIR
jgi:teichuronic acid biosynthesis glycosyltransferase TuaG